MKTADVPGGKPTVALSVVALVLIVFAAGLTVTGAKAASPQKEKSPASTAHEGSTKAGAPTAAPHATRQVPAGHTGARDAPAPGAVRPAPHGVAAVAPRRERRTTSTVGGMVDRWLPAVLPPGVAGAGGRAPSVTVNWGSAGGW